MKEFEFNLIESDETLCAENLYGFCIKSDGNL